MQQFQLDRYETPGDFEHRVFPRAHRDLAQDLRAREPSTASVRDRRRAGFGAVNECRPTLAAVVACIQSMLP